MPKLRIVIINDSSTARGGATGLSIKLANALMAKGFLVTLIAGDGGPLVEGCISPGVEIVTLNEKPFITRHTNSSILSGLYNWNAASLINNWIENNDNEQTVYHVHGWSQVLSPSIFRVLKKVENRTVVHAHDYFLACPNGGFMDYQSMIGCNRKPLGLACIMTNCDKRSYTQKLWRVMRQLVLWKIINRNSPSHKIVLLHRGMASKLLAGGWRKESLLTVSNPATSCTEKRVTCEYNETFFFIGRLVQEKGIEDAILACESVNAVLEVIGDGPMRHSLSEKYPNVVFHGWCERDEIGQRLKTARAVIMSSRYPEPFGLVAVEASLSGLPVILPDSALLSSEITRYKLGYMYSSNDVNSLSQAVSEVQHMSFVDIKNISIKAHSGVCRIASEPNHWVDSLISVYTSRVSTSGAV